MHDIQAHLRSLPMSAQKVRLVVDLVRGKDANEALEMLRTAIARGEAALDEPHDHGEREVGGAREGDGAARPQREGVGAAVALDHVHAVRTEPRHRVLERSGARGVAFHDEIRGSTQYQRREIPTLVPAVGLSRQPFLDLSGINQRFQQRLAREEVRLIIAVNFGVQAREAHEERRP